MGARLTLLFASTNPHKIGEVRSILEPQGIEIVALRDLEAPVPEPVEDGDTFSANARIKAVHYARATGRWCLADDSGLEVDALGGAPGVRSARYAGTAGTRGERDAANNARLLRELEHVADDKRTARFVCAMCLSDPSGRVAAETAGMFEGLIARRPRGSNGFGYDPLLYVPDAARTSAELTPQEKNARSHRGHAARAMAQRITSVGL